MEKYIDDDNGDQVEILRRASITIRFLEINERVSPPTDHEIRWYYERQKFLIKQVWFIRNDKNSFVDWKYFHIYELFTWNNLMRF